MADELFHGMTGRQTESDRLNRERERAHARRALPSPNPLLAKHELPNQIRPRCLVPSASQSPTQIVLASSSPNWPAAADRIVGWRSWPRSYCGRWFRRRRWTRRRCCATWWPTSRASRATRPRYRWPSSGTASLTPPTASTPPRPAGGRPGATCSGRSRPGPSSSPRTPSSASTRSAPVPSPSSRHRSSSAERAPIRCASGCDLVG